MLKQEVRYYIEVFSLDKDYITEVPGVNIRQTSNRIIDTYVNSTVIIGQISKIVPIVGSIVSAKATHIYVRDFLSKSLLEMKKDAIKVYEHYTKH